VWLWKSSEGGHAECRCSPLVAGADTAKCLSGARNVAKGSARADTEAVWGSGSVLVWVGLGLL